MLEDVEKDGKCVLCAFVPFCEAYVSLSGVCMFAMYICVWSHLFVQHCMPHFVV